MAKRGKAKLTRRPLPVGLEIRTDVKHGCKLQLGRMLQRLPIYTAALLPNQICELADKAPPTAVEKHYFQQVTFPKPAPFQTPFKRKQNNNLLFAIRGDLAITASQDDED